MTAPVSPPQRSVSDRLVLRAVALAMEPAGALRVRAEELLRIANGNRSALDRALGRIEWGQLHRPSRFAASASDALRLALSLGERDRADGE